MVRITAVMPVTKAWARPASSSLPGRRISGRRLSSASTARKEKSVAPAAQKAQPGVSRTVPASGHLATRSRSNMPQWPAARPSKLTFQGWSKASITK